MQKVKKSTGKTVVVDIRDGLAEVTAKPVSIRVIIRDFDMTDAPKGYGMTVWK